MSVGLRSGVDFLVLQRCHISRYPGLNFQGTTKMTPRRWEGGGPNRLACRTSARGTEFERYVMSCVLPRLMIPEF